MADVSRTAAPAPPLLRKGSQGDAVKGLQNALNMRNGAGLPIDCVFGATTEQAVVQFQTDAGLDVDGIVGPGTWGTLGVYAVQRGDTLSRIAEHQLHDKQRWPEIFDLNRELIHDPNKIFPGQVLTLPF